MLSAVKRRRSTDSEGNSKLSKVMCVFRLESESELSSGSESEGSFQEQDTATAHDTSDTSSKSEESEYSLASLSEGEAPEVSSGPDDVVIVGDFAELVSEFGSDISIVADPSESSASEDIEIGKADHWKCIKCGTTNKNPCLSLCLKCFKERRTYFPPRPRSRRKSHSVKAGPATLPPEDTNVNPSPNQQLLNDIPISNESNSVSEPKCGCCFSSPVNAVFLHRDTAHQVFCYKCSQRVWLERKKCCPCCNQNSKVIKLFKADVMTAT